jgi:mono/diheme cytochrome c family protein
VAKPAPALALDAMTIPQAAGRRPTRRCLTAPRARIPDMKKFRFAALTVCLAALLAGCDGAPPPGTIRLATDDPAVLAKGEAIYRQQCAACHGAQLQGQPRWRERDASGRLPAPPHDASGHTWHHPDEVLFRITKYGVAKAANLQDYDSAMPAYEGVLGDDDIVAVLSWIKAQWPAAIRAQQEEVNAAAVRRGAERPHPRPLPQAGEGAKAR